MQPVHAKVLQQLNDAVTQLDKTSKQFCDAISTFDDYKVTSQTYIQPNNRF